MKINFFILGSVQITLGEQQVRLNTLKGQALLFYLLTENVWEPETVYSRETLMELLWPGMPQKSAQDNLRQAVYQLRKGLVKHGYSGPAPLLSDRYTIGLNPQFQYQLDAQRFKEILAEMPAQAADESSQHLQHAVRLYRGEFLADFSLPDSAAFNDWLQVRREQFRRMAFGLFHQLAETALQARDFESAEGYARRQVTLDPFQEEAQRQLIVSEFFQQGPAAALAAYEKYRLNLQAELGLEPDIKLKTLLDQMRAHPQALDLKLFSQQQHAFWRSSLAASPGNESMSFWGRATELQWLKARLERVLRNELSVAFITGEAGSGKTALVHEFARQAKKLVPDLQIAFGAGNAFTGQGDAFLPFRDVLAQLAGPGETLWPQSTGTQDLLFEHITRNLILRAQASPLLILLDDLQWTDSASLRLLFHLCRRLGGSPVFILGTYRPSEVKPGVEAGSTPVLQQVVHELRRLFGDIRIDLDLFQPVEAQAFIESFLAQDPSITPNKLSQKFHTQLFWRTKGQPLFTIELVREMQSRGSLIKNEEGFWCEGPELDWNHVPARVEAVIQQRLQRLDTHLFELLSAASVEGETFTAQIAARVAGLDERTTIKHLTHELERHFRVIRSQGEVQLGKVRLDIFVFSHAIIQQYLYNTLHPAERRLLHGEIAGLLEEIASTTSQDMSVQLAHHYDQAGVTEKAASYLIKAGDQARTLYAHEEAASHYRRAIDLLKGSGNAKAAAACLMKLGLTYHTAFNFEAARKVYQEGFKLMGKTERLKVAPQLEAAPHPLRLQWQDPPSLDPTLGGTSLTAPIVTQLFSGMVTINPNLEVMPDVASSWELLDGGRKYVFHLRQDVYWSDGRRVTADDFEFTFKRALHPATKAPVAPLLLHGIRGAKDYHLGITSSPDTVGIYCPDGFTLVIEMEEPVSYFLQQLSYYVLLPVPRHAVEQYGNAWSEPAHLVTNGPFRLQTWIKGELMRLERSPSYHGTFEGNLAQVELFLGLSPEESLLRYEQDRLDVVTNLFVPTPLFSPYIHRSPTEYDSRPEFVTSYLILNPDYKPFDDKKVRQAFACCIPHQQLIETLFHNLETPGEGGFIPPGMPGFSHGIGLGHDPEKARGLWSEANLSEDSSVKSLYILANQYRQSLVEFLIHSWREILQVEIAAKLVDAQEYQQLFLGHRPPLAVAGWWADYADPENFLRVCVQMDLPEWRHAPYESLLEEARRTVDQPLRMEIYKKADQILMEEAVIVPLYYLRKHRLMKPWVENFQSLAIKHPGFYKDVSITAHNG